MIHIVKIFLTIYFCLPYVQCSAYNKRRSVVCWILLIPRVLKCVRMPLLKPRFIIDHVAPNPLVRQSFECRDLVDEAKDYHLMPKRKEILKSFRFLLRFSYVRRLVKFSVYHVNEHCLCMVACSVKQRCCHEVPGMIYAVGGLGQSNDSFSAVEVYNPKTGALYCSLQYGQKIMICILLHDYTSQNEALLWICVIIHLRCISTSHSCESESMGL